MQSGYEGWCSRSKIWLMDLFSWNWRIERAYDKLWNNENSKKFRKINLKKLSCNKIKENDFYVLKWKNLQKSNQEHLY